MPRLKSKRTSEQADHLMTVAQDLFAQRGVDGVTVREIGQASAMNHAAVGYHFGSKEALVRALVADGAMAVDARRQQLLNGCEARGGPENVREVVDILLYSAINLEGPPIGRDSSYARFIVMLAMTHRELFVDAIPEIATRGYRRAIRHLWERMPPMSNATKRQRLVFAGVYLGRMLAFREAALADEHKRHRSWQSREILLNLAATVTAIIEAPEENKPVLAEGSTHCFPQGVNND